MRTVTSSHLLLAAGHLIASVAAGNLFEGCYTTVSTGTRTTTQATVDDCVVSSSHTGRTVERSSKG
jgi:hypothetical protein